MNLNRKIAKQFIQKLIADGFAKVDERREDSFVVYSATIQGISWLKDYKTLVKP